MVRLSKDVTQHLEKTRISALCAVEIYNKPGMTFRTRTYVVLMVIAWTDLFHAKFYRGKLKPWHVASGTGRGTRYVKVDGEPKHWELSKCLTRYYEERNSPERSNLEFMLRLRNKIEHGTIPSWTRPCMVNARRC